jgi:hypothetical protein
MNAYPLLADPAWLRLGIVGLDILAVIATVRLCGAVTNWWRMAHHTRSAPATTRAANRRPIRY